MNGKFHEGLARDEHLQPGSDRGFGIVMAVVFLLLAAFVAWRGHASWPIWLSLSAAFAAAAWLKPGLLAPLNRVWFRFGLLLHRVTTPLIMGLLFFAVVTPIGLLMRAFRKRPLALGFDQDKPTYWISRQASPPGSMKKQY